MSKRLKKVRCPVCWNQMHYHVFIKEVPEMKLLVDIEKKGLVYYCDQGCCQIIVYPNKQNWYH